MQNNIHPAITSIEKAVCRWDNQSSKDLLFSCTQFRYLNFTVINHEVLRRVNKVVVEVYDRLPDLLTRQAAFDDRDLHRG